jgi:energy-coupling factor transporter ATP-binding protein EcfA2
MNQHNFNDSFNARYLDFDEVAKTFITNDQYFDLSKKNHSLLMGPRGSGKTTLLKMLTPPGHHYLKKNNKEIADLPFTAVYIPSDIQWKKQMDHFYKQGTIAQEKKEIISRFLVATNILICITNTFRYLIEFEFAEPKLDAITCLKKEAELCRFLVLDLDIEEPISPNLLALQKVLDKRIRSCNKLINRLKFGSVSSAELEDVPEFYFNDYYQLLSSACTSFENVFCGGRSRKWALCFDELEISPQWLQFELIDKLRSVDQRFYFKLVTSPIISLVDRIESDPINASEDEDYKIVRTWNYNDSCTSKWNEFSKKLTENKLRNLNLGISADQLFGESTYERNLKLSFRVDEKLKLATKYEKGSYYWNVFRELALIDSSFTAFLKKKQIPISNPAPRDTDEKDKIFRKVLPIVIFRYQFNKSFGRRSRKNPSLFYGVPFIYEACDGNPRFLMNLLDSLFGSLKSNEKPVLDINRQSSIIKSTSHKYLELIRAHPDANREIFSNHIINLGDIINQIGSYFRDRLLRGDFSMDPAGSFIVDAKVSPHIVALIELGVHLGAIIYLDPDEGISKSGLIGKKLRLCYLLHPIFDFPKREYNSINLSTILYKGSSNQIESQLIIEL